MRKGETYVWLAIQGNFDAAPVSLYSGQNDRREPDSLGVCAVSLCSLQWYVEKADSRGITGDSHLLKNCTKPETQLIKQTACHY